jgi:NLI interacting factor-like phosphatase
MFAKNHVPCHWRISGSPLEPRYRFPITYPLQSIIAVDDTPQKHARNFGNLVKVTEYLGQPDDDELLHLVTFLEQLKDVPNVRVVEKRGWQRKVRRHVIENGA